jgi:DNA (cytosine-5)-methyltransferase 1
MQQILMFCAAEPPVNHSAWQATEAEWMMSAGSLALVFCSVARRYRPRWVVWENVTGVLSSNEGRDFAAFLAQLGQCGYGFAWRVLNAQYFGSPQRRRRVFLVGHLGDWHPACAILFERESFARHPDAITAQGHAAAAEIAGSLIELDWSHTNAEGSSGLPYLTASNLGKTVNNQTPLIVFDDGRVRRLTPRECERLQGVPDDYTAITYRGKPATDTLRYRALGNAWAVPVARWIGERIAAVERNLK